MQRKATAHKAYHERQCAETEVKAFGHRFDRRLKKYLKYSPDGIDDDDLATMLSESMNIGRDRLEGMEMALELYGNGVQNIVSAWMAAQFGAQHNPEYDNPDDPASCNSVGR